MTGCLIEDSRESFSIENTKVPDGKENFQTSYSKQTHTWVNSNKVSFENLLFIQNPAGFNKWTKRLQKKKTLESLSDY